MLGVKSQTLDRTLEGLEKLAGVAPRAYFTADQVRTRLGQEENEGAESYDGTFDVRDVDALLLVLCEDGYARFRQRGESRFYKLGRKKR